MSLKRDESGRLHIETPLMAESLMDRALLRGTDTDSGAFLAAEVVGARRCILVKDERGLLTADPKKDPEARFIPESAFVSRACCPGG